MDKRTLIDSSINFDPKAKLNLLYDKTVTSLEIDANVPVIRYFRSGKEIIRMAEQYTKDGNWEKSYIYYIKYLTIFINKIQDHPEFKTFSAEEKNESQKKLRQILPEAEKIKAKLLEKYKNDFVKWQDDQKKRLETKTTDIDVAKKSAEKEDKPENTFEDLTSKTSCDNRGLRDIIVPEKLISEFLSHASINTINNKETCGILAGKLRKDQLIITHLLIPKQSGSSDSCLTHNEEEIFDYQDQLNLITLGWIHTHPTQTAFLSSVDLHTHCAYQLMMAEAIAIVCAPKYNETRHFMLTPDHGLNFIARCRSTGFHPHPNESSLYTHAQHSKLDQAADIQVVDLRRK